MSLKSIVSALGGDLYAGGRRANVPAPGHSAADRSVSLLLADGRVVIHGFGGTDWRAVRDDLVRRGLLDHDGRIPAGVDRQTASSMPRPDARMRRAAAERLWDAGLALTPHQASGRYLLRRRACGGLAVSDLRHHPAAPVSVYAQDGPTRPALMARITAPDGGLTAVELTYLERGGEPARSLRLPRKTVGLVPAGSAVRLCAPAEQFLVAEGVITTLSAMAWFGRPGWALMAVRNLAVWSPPDGVRHVIIAGDRGAPGEAAAERLRRRLLGLGLQSEVRLPAPGFGDWNEAAHAMRAAKGGGRAGRGAGAAGIGPAGRRETPP